MILTRDYIRNFLFYWFLILQLLIFWGVLFGSIWSTLLYFKLVDHGNVDIVVIIFNFVFVEQKRWDIALVGVTMGIIAGFAFCVQQTYLLFRISAQYVVDHWIPSVEE